MRSCRRWSQADSLALDSPPPVAVVALRATACNMFRIGGPVSATSSPLSDPDGGRSRLGGPSSLQQAYAQPPSLPPRLVPPPPLSSTSPQKPLPPAPAVQRTVIATDPMAPLLCAPQPAADLPAIPESSQWDDQRRRVPVQKPSDRLERNSSARVSGRSAYRTINRRTASPAAASASVTATTDCRRNSQVRLLS